MEVLLVKDVQGIGQKNQLLNVGDGFALNNLLPKGCAVVATSAIKAKFATEIAEREAAKTQSSMQADDAVTAVNGKEVTMTAKATKTGKLYAAVTEEKLVELISEQLSLSISPASIIIEEQIKALGSFKVPVHSGNTKAICTLTITEETSTS